jgi:hypothetical protein
MRIVQLIAENIKAIKAVSIHPKGDTVVISGRNAQGKSSVLDSIEYALGGQSAICEEPIRKGQQNARVVCDLGDIVVERTFSAVSGDSQLRVKTKDGKPVKSPQAMLDALCSSVAFDPLSFTRMKPQDQADALCKLVGLDKAFAELKAKREQIYNERELKGRELRAAKAKLPEFPFHPDAPEAEVNVSACQAKLETIKKQRADNAVVRNAAATAKLKLSSLGDSILNLQGEILRLEKLLAERKAVLDMKLADQKTAQADLVNAELASSQLVEDDEAQVLQELNQITTINQKVQANRLHTKANEEVQRHQFDYDKMTAEIEAIDQEKVDSLTWAEFPLDGLGFDESRVTYSGIPFSQCNSAKQLEVAVAIGLAMNPKVRVILIRDASLLDDESMKLVSALAVKHDAQIWLEVVNSNDPAAVVIEDGEVKA